MTNTMKKITKRERFETLLTFDAVKADQGMVDFINHELELLSKKNSGDKKMTAQQKANEEIKEAILEGMQENRLYTITEIQKEIAECNELSNQKVSALMRQLKEVGKVERTEDKRKTFFSKIVSEN